MSQENENILEILNKINESTEEISSVLSFLKGVLHVICNNFDVGGIVDDKEKAWGTHVFHEINDALCNVNLIKDSCGTIRLIIADVKNGKLP